MIFGSWPNTYLVPVRREGGWPVLGVDGKVPETLNLPLSKGSILGIVSSDEFFMKKNDPHDCLLLLVMNHKSG